MALVGLMNFCQWYALIIFGTGEAGLIGYSVFQIIAGVTCMTSTGCPMMFTLAADVMPQDDRELAFGISYAGVFTGTFLTSIGGFAVARIRPGELKPVLYYLVFLSIAFFVTLSTIRPLPVKSSSRGKKSSADKAVDDPEDLSAAVKRRLQEEAAAL